MTPEGGYVGPEQMFSALFGGEKFVPIIGSVSLAKKMKAAMQEAEGEEDDDEEDSVAAGASGKMNVSRQEGGGGGLGGIRNAIQRCCRLGKRLRGMEQRGRSRRRGRRSEERISKLFENLERKVAIFTEIAAGPNDRSMGINKCAN